MDFFKLCIRFTIPILGIIIPIMGVIKSSLLINVKFAKAMVFVTIILMDLLTGTEFDLFVPSFAEMQAHFNLTPFWVEALLSVNFIGYFFSLFFVGAMADRYGRKPIIIAGLITFVMGSILCVWAPTYNVILAGRFLQGMGIAAPAILSFLIIADIYPIKKQQYLFAIMNGIMNASCGLAPVAGSYISLYFHWQGNFIVLLGMGVLTLIMTLLFIPAHKLPEHKETLLLGGYIPIFKSKPLVTLIVSMVCMFLPYWIFVGMSPLLYIKDLGVSLEHFGYYQGVLALVFAFGSICYGLFVRRYSQVKMLYISNLIWIACLVMVAMAAFTDSANPLLITLVFLPFTIGQIIPSAINYPICLNFMPQLKGRVSALLQGGRLVFASLGLQLAGYFYHGSFQNIGIIISVFILFAIISLFCVINNRELIKVTQAE